MEAAGGEGLIICGDISGAWKGVVREAWYWAIGMIEENLKSGEFLDRFGR